MRCQEAPIRARRCQSLRSRRRRGNAEFHLSCARIRHSTQEKTKMNRVSRTVVAVLALAAAPAHAQHDEAAVTTYLPNAENSKIVTVTTTGQPVARVIVQTQ